MFAIPFLTTDATAAMPGALASPALGLPPKISTPEFPLATNFESLELTPTFFEMVLPEPETIETAPTAKVTLPEQTAIDLQPRPKSGEELSGNEILVGTEDIQELLPLPAFSTNDLTGLKKPDVQITPTQKLFNTESSQAAVAPSIPDLAPQVEPETLPSQPMLPATRQTADAMAHNQSSDELNITSEKRTVPQKAVEPVQTGFLAQPKLNKGGDFAPEKMGSIPVSVVSSRFAATATKHAETPKLSAQRTGQTAELPMAANQVTPTLTAQTEPEKSGPVPHQASPVNKGLEQTAVLQIPLSITSEIEDLNDNQRTLVSEARREPSWTQTKSPLPSAVSPAASLAATPSAITSFPSLQLTSEMHIEAQTAIGAPSAQNEVGLPNSTAPTASQPTAAPLTRQIFSHLQIPFAQQTDLQLAPEELGRLRFSVQTTELGITLHIQADRQETADLLRRHLAGLEQEFAELGYTDINFAFADQQKRDSKTTENGATSSEKLDAIELPESELVASPGRTQTTSGLDLRL